MKNIAVLVLTLALTGVLVPGCGPSAATSKEHRDEATGLERYSPGMFREVAELLALQGSLSEPEAVDLLLSELLRRSLDLGALPRLSSSAAETLMGLIELGYGGVSATAYGQTAAARGIGVDVLSLAIGLDPALAGASDLTTTAPGAATLAGAARRALRLVAADSPAACSSAAFATSGATFDPGAPQSVWVDATCEPEVWVGEDCEADVWVDGECVDEWVDEECTAGAWQDEGWYEYFCRSYDDCRYVWREHWVYYDGACEPGHWLQTCDEGHWEQGACAGGHWEQGACDLGHYEYTYPAAEWTFSALTVPLPCIEVRPAQYTLAGAAVEILRAHFLGDLSPERRAALLALMAQGNLVDPSEATLAAVLQVLDGILADTP